MNSIEKAVRARVDSFIHQAIDRVLDSYQDHIAGPEYGAGDDADAAMKKLREYHMTGRTIIGHLDSLLRLSGRGAEKAAEPASPSAESLISAANDELAAGRAPG